ncbi:circadian clock-controlled protein daywake-like [Zophobas morio]|uniref:circadian clock-controlled protein daywake-like n=1 Tax=Zophobas morio TaxID=2755281 RepID=UPI003082C37C
MIIFKNLILWLLSHLFSFHTPPSPTASIFPPNFKRCHRRQADFNQCLIEAAGIGLRNLVIPFDSVGLPTLRTVRVDSLNVSKGKTVGFDQNYDNLVFHGFTNATFLRFDVNFENERIVTETLFPEVTMDFDYNFNGKILENPFFGKGHGLITFINLRFSFIFDLEQYQNMGQNYFRIVKSKLSMDTDLIKSHFDNLFDGHEEMKDKFNADINENWRSIFVDVRPKYEEIFGQVFTDVFSGFLERVPIVELFGE